MVGPRILATLGLACVLLAAQGASAEVLSIERILLPKAIADRISGSGVEGRSFAALSGASQKVDIGMLRVRVSPGVALRAGVGMAKLRAVTFENETRGTAMAGGVSLSFWKRSGLTLSFEASGLRTSYDRGSVLDGTMLVALSGR